ncbi:MAG TPA: hypothetical protein DCM02_13700 [Flavobacterium sp.]|nr:hypothetical protein [Flavobacterium sp.]
MLLSSGCTAKEIQQKEKKKDFSHLKIQTVLSPEDQAYYKRVHNEISEIGKHFAYREENAEKKYCPVLGKMFDEISVRPISRERERERERQVNLLFYLCNRDNVFSESYKPITCEKYKYISTKITNSASIFSALANYEGNFLSDKKLSSETRSKHKKKFKFYWNQSLLVDPIDLSPFMYETDSQKEYCKKAVEQRQWDHISHLLRLDTGVHSLIRCLDRNNPDHKECNCPEAVELFVKMTPKKYLIDRSALDPSDIEFDITISANELIKVIKKTTGRDLNKEPKVYYYEGDPGR